MLAVDYGFASTSDLKRRIGVRDSDQADDALFHDLLRTVSFAMETFCGRPLRRRHGETERHIGGGRIIKVGTAPIVQIHSIRESETRIFDDSDEYTELVEEDDYIIEPSYDGSPIGNTGEIRRVNGNWLGSENEPGRLQVKYTGGYRTPQELTIEQTTATNVQIATADTKGLQTSISAGTLYGSTLATLDVTALKVSAATQQHGIIRYDTSGSILPTWKIRAMLLQLFVRRLVGGTSTLKLYIMEKDPLSLTDQQIFENATAGELIHTENVTSTSYISLNGGTGINITSEAVRSAVHRALVEGHFTIVMATEESASLLMALPDNTDASVRPVYRFDFTPLSPDPHISRRDLQHACLIQSAHEYQNRRSPGSTTQAQRGITIASGATLMKPTMDFLPEVVRILAPYRRIF